MRAERDKLHADVFPKLRKYCESNGFSFQPIDLRWGVSSEAGNDQKTMQICIDEVKHCKHALNPHFVMLLGERYGWIPLPASVPVSEFEQVRLAILECYKSGSEEINYLDLWYRRDDNAIPAEYKLQPKLTAEHQTWEYWSKVESTLRGAFSYVVNHSLKDKLTSKQKTKYLKSATEQEIIEGLFNNEGIAKEYIFFYNRNFSNIDQLTPEEFSVLEASDKAYREEVESFNEMHINEKKPVYETTVKHFSDFTGNALDQEIRKNHLLLIDNIITELPSQNIKTYDLTLNPSLKRTQDSVTDVYLEQFSKDFYDTIFTSIQKEIKSFQEVDSLARELKEQENFLHEKSKVFVGRDIFLNFIAGYITSEVSNAPLIIYADSGSGKSSLLAKAIQDSLTQQTNDTMIIYRFVGVSQNSNTPTKLYQSLYHQLMQVEVLQELRNTYLENGELDLDQVLGDLNELNKFFAFLLEHFPEELTLVLFIDALDQFTIHDSLDWLPKSLPTNIKIILSTLPDSYQGVPYLPILKRKYRTNQENLLFLTAFDFKEATSMIDEYLQAKSRRVSEIQKQKLLDAFNQSGSPLYLKILLEEAKEWASYTDVSNEEYPEMLEDLIHRLFIRLHTHFHHSLPLINFAFSYLACSKDGLPESELFDILSQEESLMDDVSNAFYPRPSRLPTAVWARLNAQMSHYLLIKEIDAIDQYSFFHRKFNEGAYKLLGGKEETHRRLANYFQAVYDQVHEFDLSLSSALTELPYQLIMSGQSKRALELLTNFDFLMKKFKFNRTAEVVDDFTLLKNLGLDKLPENELLNERFYIFNVFIQSNKHILEKGDQEWDSSKIFFQLSIEHADNSPLTYEAEAYERDDKVTFDYVRDVNRDAEMYIIPPSIQLAGHKGDVNGVIELKDSTLLSWSEDKTLRLWRSDGELIAVLAGHDECVRGVIELKDGRLLSWSRDGKLRLWGSDGELIAVLAGHEDYVRGVIELRDGRLLSWSRDKTLRLWGSDGELIAVLAGHEDFVSDVIELKDGRLLSRSHDKTLRLWRSDGKLITVLTGHEDYVTGARELKDGRLLSWSEDKKLRLWRSDGIQIAVFEGHANVIYGALELTDGRLLSWSRDKTLRLWRSDGDLIAVLAGHEANVNGVIELKDGRLLSWSRDKTLRLWRSDGDLIAVLAGHEADVKNAIELKDGRLLSWSDDRTLRFWSDVGEVIAVFEGHRGHIRGALELCDGRLLSWSGSKDDVIRVWDIEIKYAKKNNITPIFINHNVIITPDTIITPGFLWKNKKIKKIMLDFDIHTTIKLTNGMFLSWNRKNLNLWDDSGTVLKLLAGHEGDVDGVIELKDGRLLSWSNLTLRLWCSDGELIAVLEGHEADVSDVIELRDGKLLSWSEDGILKLWGSDGELIAVLAVDVSDVTELKDGRLLSRSEDGILRLWRSDGEIIAVLAGHEDYVRGVIELKDGRLLSWSRDKTLRLWRSDGELIAVLAGHESPVYDAIELKEGILISWSDSIDGDWSKALLLWDSHGALIATLQTSGMVRDVIELPDGNFLSLDHKTIRKWNKNGDLIEIIDKDNLSQMVQYVDYFQYKDCGCCKYQNMAVYEMSNRVVFLNDNKDEIRWHSTMLNPKLIGNHQESLAVNSDNKIRFLEIIKAPLRQHG